MCAARGVDRECCVMVAKTGCVMDGKIYMSQKKIINCNRSGEKNMHFIMKTLLI